MSKRTEVGTGTPCAIYVLDHGTHSDGVVGYQGETAMCASVGEDFADCSWPVVVKAKFDVDRETLIRRLRDLADAIEQRRLFIDRQDVGLSDAPWTAFCSPSSRDE